MSFFRAFGAYLPARVVDNEYLAPLVGESPEWIVNACGIHQRRYAAPDETVTSMATLAAQDCLSRAGVEAAEIGMLIVASGSADRFCPGPAATVAASLGLAATFALDVPVASAGSLIALTIAEKFANNAKKVLVIASETMSKRINLTPEGRNTAILFGDGAGACLVDAEQGFLEIKDTHLQTDGSQSEILHMQDNRLIMDGGSVIMQASRKIPASVKALLARNTTEPPSIGTVLMHQANLNLIERVAKSTAIPLDRFYVNIDRYGNTSSASLLVAAAEWRAANLGVPRDNVLFAAFGTGLNWGSLLATPVAS